eukprot:TRINITY_DN30461_c0_g1_i1.p1 TRINITY_DN30461_c0_g1~~TRINITY_DN30461_c0_g1_i1.p1  ORF type:complete len:205 (+),score=15.67 TRINITY_DN30461_c0_g1_i1:72-617(+)
MSFAQNTKSDHLSFKGVPLDGSLSEFVSKMKQSGFDHEGTEGETASLKGDFAGYKNCFVEVSTLKQKDLVHKIVVAFPAKDTWAALFENYSNLKELLAEKYGKASDVVEKFSGQDSKEGDDRTKMYHVKLDNCKYYSIWQTEKGRIELSIANLRLQKCFVKVSYSDKANGDIIRDKAKEDL